MQVPTDSTDSPTHEIQILETVVFVNPYETDLKQYYEEKAEKDAIKAKAAEKEQTLKV